jgi:hypothetical protein
MRRALTIAVFAAVVALTAAPAAVRGAAAVPARLTDTEFWQLVETLSEPNGFFSSSNLVSNENTFQGLIPRLKETVKPGGVYMGVGPDQNFTYIASLQPSIAFILDIRRGNLLEQLMYKAIVELSADRADFLSRLFSRKRPAGLTKDSPVEDLFVAFEREPPVEALYDANVLAIVNHLRVRHKFPLDDDDAAGIGTIFMAFYAAGPNLTYSSQGAGRSRYPSYRDLQISTDGDGHNHAYLGSDDQFRALKSLEERNLIVPVVGNFAGPKALRAIASWIKARDAVVTTFYLSNVEQYLFQDGLWELFARNVAQLPLDPSSTFIRSCFTGCVGVRPFPSGSVMQMDSMTGVLRAFDEGRIRTYADLLSHPYVR